jgi:hypothetical protein
MYYEQKSRHRLKQRQHRHVRWRPALSNSTIYGSMYEPDRDMAIDEIMLETIVSDIRSMTMEFTSQVNQIYSIRSSMNLMFRRHRSIMFSMT